MNRLLSSGIPETVIKKKTGRSSEKSDLAYVNLPEFEKQMSDALYHVTPEPDTICEVKSAPSSSVVNHINENKNVFSFRYRNADKEISFDLPM